MSAAVGSYRPVSPVDAASRKEVTAVQPDSIVADLYSQKSTHLTGLLFIRSLAGRCNDFLKAEKNKNVLSVIRSVTKGVLGLVSYAADAKQLDKIVQMATCTQNPEELKENGAKLQLMERRAKLLIQLLKTYTQYVPSDDGSLTLNGASTVTLPFTLYQLTWVLNHIIDKYILKLDDVIAANGATITSLDKMDFHVKFEKGNVVIVTNAQQIPHTCVYKVWSVTSGVIAAMKTADTKNDLEKIQLLREHRILCHINKDGGYEGFQGTPHCLLNTGTVYAIVGPFYQNTIYEWSKTPTLTIRDRLICAKQLMQALVKMQQLKIFHRDLKPINVMMDSRPVVIDWESAITCGALEERTLGKPSEVIYVNNTPAFVDTQAMAALTIAEKQKDVKEVTANCKTLDLYAMTIVIYNALTSRLPFKIMPGSKDSKMRVKRLLKMGYSPNIIDKLRKMLAFDKKDRLPEAETIAFWTTLDPDKANVNS